MLPKTSVRQPIIAGARRRHLNELLRQWRRQPRKRSPLLFWTLLALALMSDSGLLLLTTRFLGLWGFATQTTERCIDAPNVSDSALWEAPTWDGRAHEGTIAPHALYWSLLGVASFTAAAAVRLRWPLWHRRLMFLGLLSCFGCLAWSAAVLLDQTNRNGGLPIYDGSQGILWLATVITGMSLFLAGLFRDVFPAIAGALTTSMGYLAANYWPTAFTELWPTAPQGGADGTCFCLQVLMLLSAYAVLALAWSTAALALTMVLLEAPSSERLHRLANYCLWPIRLGVVLLAGSAFLDGWRALEEGSAWHRWVAQAMGTLLVLPGCVALVYARRRGFVLPFRLLAAVVLGFTFLAMTWHFAARFGAGDLHFSFARPDDLGYYVAGLFPLSLAVHAALRYYFGKQRNLEV